MSGLIRNEDVAYVRDHTQIDAVIGEYVQLKHAGGGQKKGLCPFHDEKSPSFNVNTTKGFFHCFGCGAGGDVIAFVMKLDHTSFTEAIERLADRIGYQLQYEESSGPSKPSINKSRLVAANKAAMEFYCAELNQAGPAAQAGREFLQKRGFDKSAAEKFSVGFAPDQWDALYKHLKSLDFTEEEMNTAGLIKEGSRGNYIDRYRNRLIWPVRNISGDVVGFGARKMASDEANPNDQSPKYLNTSETPIYKKSQLLYGLDLAKKEIMSKRQVVVVEGYTDVMAAQLAGVTTAVATCGTAFGDDHIKVIRNLLMDSDAFSGEVIFTFDGDAAGQKAALKAFDDDQKFATQTFVAIAPDGMDPCELRMAHGDEAVRDLVARRIPLFEFAMRVVIAKFDLNNPEGRVSALNQVAPLVGKIKDASLRPEYIKSIAGWLGLDMDIVSAAVKKVAGKSHVALPEAPPPNVNLKDPVLLLEREVLKVRLQFPELVAEWNEIEQSAFSYPPYQSIRELIDGSSGSTIQDLAAAVAPELASILSELLVEPVRTDGEVSERYVSAVISRIREVALSRQIAELKSTLQRVNPVDEPERYGLLFAEMVGMERLRQEQKARALGESSV